MTTTMPAAAYPDLHSMDNTLLLVDGSSYLYRAFHAMPDLRAVPGDPSSPARGIATGILRFLNIGQ